MTASCQIRCQRVPRTMQPCEAHDRLVVRQMGLVAWKRRLRPDFFSSVAETAWLCSTRLSSHYCYAAAALPEKLAILAGVHPWAGAVWDLLAWHWQACSEPCSEHWQTCSPAQGGRPCTALRAVALLVLEVSNHFSAKFASHSRPCFCTQVTAWAA